MVRQAFSTSIVMALTLGIAMPSFACTNIIVGKNASTDGSMFVSQSVDGSDDTRIKVIPGGKHEPGTMIPVWLGGSTDNVNGKQKKQVGEIPQAAETYSYVHAAYPFMNENKILIGEDTWFGRSELRNSEAIMMIEQLQILGLQRAKTAKECVQIMGQLAEQYGYADGGETLTVIDGNEGWVFSIIGPGPLWSKDSGTPGAVWAAQRVPDDHVYVSSNRVRIGKVDLADSKNFLGSPNIVSTAVEYGFYDPAKDGEFSFAKVYNPTPYGSPYYQARREWRAFTLLIPSLKDKLSPVLADPNLDQYEFSYPVPSSKKISLQDFMAVYRDYYQGTEFDLTQGEAAGPFHTPTRAGVPSALKPADVKTSDWERAISITRCAYTLVGQSRADMPNSVGGIAWIGEDAGYSTVFIPLYSGITETSPVLYNVNRSGFERESAWWAFNFVTNWAELRFDAMMEKRIRPLQKELEDKFFALQPHVEATALALDKQDPALARAYLTDYSAKAAEDVTAKWWNLADELIYRYHDGMVELGSGGYPTEWLEKVGYGVSQLPPKK